MTTSITQLHDQIRIQNVPVLRLIIGFSLASAGLVHVVLEVTDPPFSRSAIRDQLQFAGLVILATWVVSRYSSFTIDRVNREVRWRRLQWLFPVRGSFSWDDFDRVALRCRPASWFGRCTLRLMGPNLHAVVPLGCSFSRRGLEGLVVRAREIVAALGQDRELAMEFPPQLVGEQYERSIATTRSPLYQLSLRRLIAAITVATILLGLLSQFDWKPPSILVLEVYVILLAVVVRLPEERRNRFLAVLIAFHVPYAWIILVSVPWGHTSGIIAALPLSPGMWLEMFRVVPRHQPYTPRVVAVAVIAQTLIAGGLASRSWRWAVFLVIPIYLVSSFFSLVFYALYRA